jgi:hypothetical protein
LCTDKVERQESATVATRYYRQQVGWQRLYRLCEGTHKGDDMKKQSVVLDLVFTEVEVKKIQSAASATWEYIAGDTMTMLSESGESSISRAEVIELTLDADRIRQFLRDEKLYDRFKKLSIEKQDKLVLPAFPYKRYA